MIGICRDNPNKAKCAGDKKVLGITSRGDDYDGL